MSETAYICPHCQKKSPWLPESQVTGSQPPSGQRCPHCGQTGSASRAPVPTFAPTVAVQGATCVDTDQRMRQGQELIDALVGREFGIYTVQSFLGHGGMAWVFRGWHNSLHRPCALKVLCPELQSQQGLFVKLFVDEARAAASRICPSSRVSFW